jgi:O-phospho-L-seryl-tRNASec:L-selenocysteinyl-tRNA synthase
VVDFSKIIDYFKSTSIPPNMLNRGQLVFNNFLKPLQNLFEQKNVPQKAWSDDQIEFLLKTLSNMDTDKDDKASRVGEREARIASGLQLKTSAGFCHGIGRSGFLTAPQPKAPGDALIKAFDLVGVKKKVVKGRKFGDAVRIPIEDIEASLDNDCFAIISLTSFFPPREHDNIKEISKFAKKHDLVHIVINAYGVQSPEWMKLIRIGIDAGRIDAVIQSTDKNVLTPVGGAIIASPSEDIITKISQAYAGRASATPVVNFLISMLSLGIEGYQQLLEEQQKNRKLLEDMMQKAAEKIDERILKVFNPVAVAMSLNNLRKEQLFALGGALYNLRVTGPRVYNPEESIFGTCCAEYTTPYIVLNAAIGAKSQDIISAVDRFEKAYSQVALR